MNSEMKKFHERVAAVADAMAPYLRLGGLGGIRKAPPVPAWIVREWHDELRLASAEAVCAAIDAAIRETVTDEEEDALAWRADVHRRGEDEASGYRQPRQEEDEG